MNKIKKKHLIFPIVTAILSLAVFAYLNLSPTLNKHKSYSDFLNDINANKVSQVYITPQSTMTVKLNDGTTYESDNPRNTNFKEELLKKNISVTENSPSNLKKGLPLAGFMASIVTLILMSLKGSKVLSKGMNSVDAMDAAAIEDIKYNFENVAGNDEAKESVQDIVDFLKNPEKYAAYGARLPKGIIFHGDPGTGKTLLAKAVAGEAGVPFYAMSGSDFVQVYVGVGASRIRQLFKKARSHGKAVIFIDEIDAIGKKRDGGKSGGSDEREQTLNALLTEMSGFNEKEGIVIIAATNRLDVLDSALLRPGRFDRHIEITLPDVEARSRILALHLKNKPVKDVNINEWAHKTTYFSGAKLESLVNEAAILACKENSEFIEDKHLDAAFSIVIAGYEKKNRDHIKELDRKITAYHEIGHALASLKMLPEEKVSKVTIIPSTKGAGGYTLSIPEDRLYQDKDYLKKRIMVLLGGRAAEEVVFGKDKITTGAHSDIKQCTRIALNMVANYGMGDSIGLLNLEELMNANVNSSSVLEECKKLVEDLYEDTKKLLQANIDELENMTLELLKKETLYAEDLIA